MGRVFPIKSDVNAELDDQKTIHMAGEDASLVFQTLSTETARQIYLQLTKEPSTASGLAESLEKPIQNVSYHLTSLSEAGLIHIVDTWYSSRGTEMKVYAPVSEQLLLVAGVDADNETIHLNQPSDSVGCD